MIIADEPTSALDVVVQRQVIETLRRVQEKIGASIILVGHDMGLMAQVVDRLGVMYAGALAEVCGVGAMFREPLHPYSQLLIASLPTLDRKGAFQGIPGLPPSLLNRPRGCSFPRALPACDASVAQSKRRPCAKFGPIISWPATCTRRARRNARCKPPVGNRMSALLEARAVTKIFGGGLRGPRMIAVEDFSLAIADEPPSITALVGESGSGKTTLARLLLGLIEPSEGAVLYKGADIRTLSGARSAAPFRRDVQVIFQDPFEAYNPFYRVDHVLETPVLNFGLAGSQARGAAA